MATPRISNTSSTMQSAPVGAVSRPAVRRSESHAALPFPEERSRSQLAQHSTVANGTRGISPSIPVHNYIERTPSEVQLCEDEVVADYKDYCMYTRIVNGIVSKTHQSSYHEVRYTNNELLENIIRTRHSPIQKDLKIKKVLAIDTDEDWSPGFVDLSGEHDGYEFSFWEADTADDGCIFALDI